MKRLIRGTGIVLIICAVLLFMIAGMVQEEAKPNRVRFGIMTNGSFKETDSGYIGGNAEAAEDMEWLKGVAILSGIAGTGAIIGSFVMKDEEKPQY